MLTSAFVEKFISTTKQANKRKMLSFRIKSRNAMKISCSVVRIQKREYSNAVAAKNNEDRTEPCYPPIFDTSFRARNRRKREDEAEAMRRTRTVEEKMIKLNMPRFWGWRTTIMKESEVPYNVLDQMQYLTRTHVPKEPGLPSYYGNIIEPEKLKLKVHKMRELIEDGLIFEYSARKRSNELDKETLDDAKVMDNITSQSVCKQIHRILMSYLMSDYPHLMNMEVDNDPRIEAFWFAGGLPVPNAVKHFRRKSYMPEDFIAEPVDLPMQYIGQPNFQMRHCQPLPEIFPHSESENSDFNVPVFKYNPRVSGLVQKRRHGTNIPGFWPGDTSEFGFLSYHGQGHLVNRTFGDNTDALKVQALLGSWGWLLAQACNLGFSVFNDVTYPMTNQMVITNGKTWTFCVYQLNTTVVHSNHIDDNPRRNVCWITEPMELFEKIDDNRVHGFNNEVLENLVKFYANVPRERMGVVMKPYLQDGEGLVANILGNTKRNWLEERFKHLVSNRPRHGTVPEIFDWQKIYICRTNTRPMDKKREPWEFGINEMQRKLDDHAHKYIPRCVRGEKKIDKFVKHYYPK